MRKNDLRDFLDEQVALFNQPDFIPNDPISISHRFVKPQDIEIAGLFAAVFSWGNRQTIINKSTEFLERMDNAPYEFIQHHSDSDLKRFLTFKHRTFQPTDALYFIEFLRHHYSKYTSLEDLFITENRSMEARLNHCSQTFFSLEDAPPRTKKHLPSPARKSTCKRINMFLRWMVRQDDCGVDFGLWKRISPAELICPIDVHVSTMARKYNLLYRKQNDWLSAVELTVNLRKLDPTDPVKYDFALFGMGVNGGIR